MGTDFAFSPFVGERPSREGEPPVELDVVAHYELDGIPVQLRAGRGPETAYGQAVEWGEWLYRSVRITCDEYDALVAKQTPPHLY